MYYDLIRFWICKWKAEAPISRGCGCQGVQQEEHAVITSKKKQENRSKRKEDKRTAFGLQAGSFPSGTLELVMPGCPHALLHACIWLCSGAVAEAWTETETSERDPWNDPSTDGASQSCCDLDFVRDLRSAKCCYRNLLFTSRYTDTKCACEINICLSGVLLPAWLCLMALQSIKR